MSISAANAAATPVNSRLPVQHERDAEPVSRQGSFSRKPVAAEPAKPALRAARAHAVEPTPFKPLAGALCAAASARFGRLAERGVSNPTYLGSDRGGWTYFNEENGEVGIRNLNLGHGFLGLGDMGTTCLVKDDGRIILNGETLTPDHPELPGILRALEDVRQKCSDDSLLRRSFIGGNTLQPPWNPISDSHHHYVA